MELVEAKGTPKLNKALSEAQKEIKAIGKGGRNPHFKSDYALLEDACDYLLPILSSKGLSVSQVTQILGDLLVLVTTLRHESGEFLESRWPIGKVGLRQQELGSGMTYARRYTLMAIVGLSAQDEDDDGNLASGRNNAPLSAPQKESAPKRPKSTIPTPQTRQEKLNYLKNYCVAHKLIEQASQRMIEEYGKNGSQELTDNELTEMIEWAKEQ